MTAQMDYKLFNELFERLIKEEHRGQKFFSDAARFAQDRVIAQLFQWLAAEEDRHIERLETIRKRILDDSALNKGQRIKVKEKRIEYAGENIPVFDLQLPEDDSKDPLPEVALFNPTEFVQLLKESSVKRILKYAMQVEYDNFKYIVELVKSVDTKEERAILLQLAEDEKRHFIAIQTKYDAITGNPKLVENK